MLAFLLLVSASLCLAKTMRNVDVDKVKLSKERMVFELEKYGIIEMAFYPEVAPVTVKHILEVARAGGYTTNHFFRVDKGFVAQVAGVVGNRLAPIHPRNNELFAKTIPGEMSNIPHRRGILSMARYNDPDSGTTSFSILLGNAPHLDKTYAVFGEIVAGDEVLSKLEQLPTKKEGIFVMPTERITISASYVYEAKDGIPVFNCTPDDEEEEKIEKSAQEEADHEADTLTDACPCASSLRQLFDDAIFRLKHHLKEKDRQIEAIRAKCLPGR